MDYYQKYLKYKNKYLALKGGVDNENLNFFLNFNTIGKSIIDKYENFENLDLINGSIKPIGQGSANGFINLIKYRNSKDSKIFDTVVKTSREINADNNFYEFNVGRCINVIKEYYPNFVYTFLFFNMSPRLKQIIEPKERQPRLPFNDITFFKQNINNIKIATRPNDVKISDIESGCSNNDRASVLIENIPNGISFDELITDSEFNNNYNYNIFCILLQIYSALYALREIYTHYDLHSGNIMYMKSPNIIKIVYNINNSEYIIYTKFIPIIIDYGRSHMNCSKLDSTLITSERFAENACNSKCNPLQNTHNCEINSLKFNKYNNKWFDNSDFYYINPRVKNESFDLRFINSIMQVLKQTDIKNRYLQTFNIKNNPDWFLKDKSISYGVKEHKQEPNKIETLTDIITFLTNYYINLNYLKNVPNININNSYETIRIDCDINKKIKWTYENPLQKAEPIRNNIPVFIPKVEPIKAQPFNKLPAFTPIVPVKPVVAPVKPIVAPVVAPVKPIVAPVVAPVKPIVAPVVAPVKPIVAPVVAPVKDIEQRNQSQLDIKKDKDLKQIKEFFEMYKKFKDITTNDHGIRAKKVYTGAFCLYIEEHILTPADRYIKTIDNKKLNEIINFGKEFDISVNDIMECLKKYGIGFR